jgi:hypothetical protein
MSLLVTNYQNSTFIGSLYIKYINFHLENRQNFWNRDGSVSVVPKLRDGPPVFGIGRDFSTPRPDWLWGPPSY